MAERDPSDEAYEAARERGRQFERENPKATSARYDRAFGRLVIDFENGSTLLVPARALQDLGEASDDELAEVELHRDYYLRWDRLDVDFTIPGLMAGIFGTARFMDARGRTDAPLPPPGDDAPRQDRPGGARRAG